VPLASFGTAPTLNCGCAILRELWAGLSLDVREVGGDGMTSSADQSRFKLGDSTDSPCAVETSDQTALGAANCWRARPLDLPARLLKVAWRARCGPPPPLVVDRKLLPLPCLCQ
jgi:hypothetical protein